MDPHGKTDLQDALEALDALELDDEEPADAVSTAVTDGPIRARRPVGVHYGGGLRSDLIRTALELIESEGADRLSLRAVARRVGVSWAAPAHHFGNKEGLFTAIAVGGFQLLTDRVMNAIPFQDAPEADPLGTVARLYAQFATDHPAHSEVMNRRHLLRSEDPRIDAAEERLFMAIGHLIAMSRRSGCRPKEDTDALTATAWSLAHGYCVLRAQGSLARQFFATPPPAVDQLTPALAG